MFIIEFLKKAFENRGFLPSFLVISGWSYSIILFSVVIYHFILYAIGKKYYDNEFKMSVVEEAKTTGNNIAVAKRYKIKIQVLNGWVKKCSKKK